MMLALLIPIAWLIVTLLLRPALGGRRVAMLMAAVGVAAWMLLATDILGAAGLLNRTALGIWWGVTDLLLFVAFESILPPLAPWTAGIREEKWGVNQYATAILLAMSGIILLAAGVAQIVHPASFPVPSSAPNAPLDFIRLHFTTLGNSTAWSGFVAWQSAALTAVAASLMVALAGGGPVPQALAALLVVANPTFFFAASTLNNDVIVAQWTCTLAVLLLSIIRECELRVAHAVWTGLTLSVLVLTRPTGLFFAIPLCVAIAAAVWVRRGGARKWLGILAIPLVVLLIPAGLMDRRAASLAPVRPRLTADQLNQDHSPSALATVFAANLASHLQTPAHRVNLRITGVFNSLRDLLGTSDNSPHWADDSSAGRPFTLRDPSGRPSWPGSLAILVMAILLPLLGAVANQQIRGTFFWLLLIFPFAAFVLYGFVFRWTPHAPRSAIPAICLLAAPAALVLTLRRTIPAAAILLPAILLNLLAAIIWN